MAENEGPDLKGSGSLSEKARKQTMVFNRGFRPAEAGSLVSQAAY